MNQNVGGTYSGLHTAISSDGVLLTLATLAVVVGVVGETFCDGWPKSGKDIIKSAFAALLVFGLLGELIVQPLLDRANSTLVAKLEDDAASLRERNLLLFQQIHPREIEEKQFKGVFRQTDRDSRKMISIYTATGDSEASVFAAYIYNALHHHLLTQFHPAYFMPSFGELTLGCFVFGKDQVLVKLLVASFESAGFDCLPEDPTHNFLGSRKEADDTVPDAMIFVAGRPIPEEETDASKQ